MARSRLHAATHSRRHGYVPIRLDGTDETIRHTLPTRQSSTPSQMTCRAFGKLGAPHAPRPAIQRVQRVSGYRVSRNVDGSDESRSDRGSMGRRWTIMGERARYVKLKGAEGREGLAYRGIYLRFRPLDRYTAIKTQVAPGVPGGISDLCDPNPRARSPPRRGVTVRNLATLGRLNGLNLNYNLSSSMFHLEVCVDSLDAAVA